jgi:putative inorganic carbon (HCO3(-)) transporter
VREYNAHPNDPSHSLLRRFAFFALAIAVLGAALMALFFSLSRGAWIGVAAALVVTTIIRSKRAAVLALTGALLLAVLVLLGQLNLIPDVVSERFSGVGDYFGFVDVRGVPVNDANFAIVERMAHWQAAWNMFNDHPWLGIGIGNYAAVYPAYALPHWDDPLGHAHNYYLNVLAESGIVGLAAYLVLWGAIFWTAWRAVRSTRGLAQGIAAGAFGVLIALSVHNLFDDLFVHSMQMQVGITLGLIQVVGRGARGGRDV